MSQGDIIHFNQSGIMAGASPFNAAGVSGCGGRNFGIFSTSFNANPRANSGLRYQIDRCGGHTVCYRLVAW